MAKTIPEATDSISDIDVKAIKIPQPATTEPVAKKLPEATVTAGRAPPTPKHDDEVIEMLAAMKPLEYERARHEYAKLMGCRPTVLDGLVKAARDEDGESSDLPFPEVEPFQNPVDPASLLNEISATIRLFIVMDDEQAAAAALWVAFTWFLDAVEIAPLAVINAPEKACAKSLLLDLIGRMSARPLPTLWCTGASWAYRNCCEGS